MFRIYMLSSRTKRQYLMRCMVCTGRRELNCVMMSLVAVAWQDEVEVVWDEGRPTKVVLTDLVNETLNGIAAATGRKILYFFRFIFCSFQVLPFVTIPSTCMLKLLFAPVEE